MALQPYRKAMGRKRGWARLARERPAGCGRSHTNPSAAANIPAVEMLVITSRSSTLRLFVATRGCVRELCHSRSHEPWHSGDAV